MVYQMIIKAIYIGNQEEAFIYKKFDEGFNMIYSDDNNKGKTIVIQAIIYCFGNVPFFPTDFQYQNYYYMLDILVEDELIRICRKQKNIIVYRNDTLFFFDNISEFKRYWNKEIFELPTIHKQSMSKIVDPELYIQLFFVGQDKKLTYDIVNKGYYKKEDFYNMLFAFKGVKSSSNTENQIKKMEERENNLKNERQQLLKRNKILKQSGNMEEMLGKTNDRKALERILVEADAIKNNIIELKKERNKAIARQKKNEAVLKELRSLNRSMKAGEIVCMDCGSSHISYESSDSEFSFDISTSEIRMQILKGIEDKVNVYKEEIDRLTDMINYEQDQFDKCLSVDENIPLELLLVVKKDMDTSIDADRRVVEIEKELLKLKENVNTKVAIYEDVQRKQEDILNEIIGKMNKFYQDINSVDGIKYDSIFTKRDKVYSGSDGTEFYLAKVYALCQVLKHQFPIIVDSFRTEDLSTWRENNVLEEFKKIENQIIFTTTLKTEEKGKYSLSGVNCIDFSSHTTNHILSSSYVDEFVSELQKVSINFEL